MTEASLLHADSESDANLLYATGFVVPDPVFWFRTPRASYLIVNPLELGRARAQARVDHVVDHAAWKKKLAKRAKAPPKPVEVAAAVLRSKGVDALRVPGNFPVATADALRKLRFKLTVVDGMFFPERAVKRQDEVDAIRL